MSGCAVKLAKTLRERHDAGLCGLDMDDQASAHYGEPTGGPLWLVWRARVYCRAVLNGK